MLWEHKFQTLPMGVGQILPKINMGFVTAYKTHLMPRVAALEAQILLFSTPVHSVPSLPIHHSFDDLLPFHQMSS